MATCDVCGNDYDKAFQITRAGRTMTFDSFECAIHAMALIAPIVSAIYSVMASKQEARFTAVRIVQDVRVSRA